MPFNVNCPDCEQSYIIEDEHAGRKLACDKCGCRFRVELNTAGAHAQSVSDDGKVSVSGAADSATLSPVAALAAATAKRRYAAGKLIAKGGMGMVMSSRDLSLRRDVAMKIMLDPRKAKDEQHLRFIMEAQVTGQLEHPNVVPVHELGVDENDSAFYTMKMVRGVTLKEILEKIGAGHRDTLAKYPLVRLLNIYMKTCDAVAFAHSRGVVHRDLKPENIMVGDFGEVLVMDWGLAKILGDRTEDGRRKTAELDRADPSVSSVKSVASCPALTVCARMRIPHPPC